MFQVVVPLLHLHTYLYCLGQVWVVRGRLRLELTYKLTYHTHVWVESGPVTPQNPPKELKGSLLHKPHRHRVRLHVTQTGMLGHDCRRST